MPLVIPNCRRGKRHNVADGGLSQAALSCEERAVLRESPSSGQAKIIVSVQGDAFGALKDRSTGEPGADRKSTQEGILDKNAFAFSR